jgi:hypothetical protein
MMPKYENKKMQRWSKKFVIEFHSSFVGKSDAKFVRCIKRDFGMVCKEEDQGDYKTWEILNNHVVVELSAQDIYDLDKNYGILCFEPPHKIILR